MGKKRVQVLSDAAIEIGRKSFCADNLLDNLYNALGSYLLNGTVDDNYIGKTILKQFKGLDKKSLEDPNNLRNIKDLMEITQATSDYFQKKQAQDKDFIEYLLYKDLFDWQKEIWNCSSKKIAIPAGRRSGKSYFVAAYMIKHCISGVDNITDPNTGFVVKKNRQAVYIGLTLEKAVSIIWQPLKDLIDKAHIPFQSINNSNHTITFSNGNSIMIYGNNSKADREKLRGFDSSLFCIDECQSQVGLAYLIESIIGPIIKGRNGLLILSGTGPLNAGTYWEEVINGERNFEIFKATMADNLSIPDYNHALQQILEENNWDENNITFRREYLGEIAYDTNRLIYSNRSYYDEIPKQKVKDIYLGVDFGFVDSTALAPIVCFENGECYLVNEFKQSRMPATDIISKINSTVEYLSKTYNFPYEKIKVRTDNNEQNIVRDIQNLYPKMDIHSASKRGEAAQIALVNDMLIGKDLLIQKNSIFDNECNRLVWKVNDNGTVRYGEIDDSEYHGDICDAVKYAISSMFANESFQRA